MRRQVTAFALASAALVAAVLLRWLLDPVLGDSLPLVTLFGAVAAAVWIGGYPVAIAVTVVGYLACDFLFIEPRGTLGLDNAQHIVGFVAYLVTSAFIVGIGEAMRWAQRRASARGELLRITLESIGDAVITTDTEARVTSLNAVAESLTGWSSADALHRPLDSIFRIVREDNGQPAANPAIRALRQGEIVGLENHVLLVARDGTVRSIDDSAAPIRDENGNVSGCVLIFRDISERRHWEKDEASRLVSARTLAAIVETSDDAIISKSLDGIIQSWNAAAERIFGYTADEAVGRHISLVIPPDRRDEEERIIASLRAGRRIDHFETERMRKDGTRFWIALTVSPITDATGRVVGASKIVRDVTRQREAEAERQKFVMLVESSTDFIGMSDVNGVPFYVNRAGLEMVGLKSLEEARRTHVRDFFFPEDQSRIMDEFFPAVVEKGHSEIEVRFRHFKTGASRWMAYKVLGLTDASGKIVAFATVSQDVTERRRMEDDLRRLAADLSDADRRKDEFLATLSHELRNPLAPLHNMLEFLKRAGGNTETLPRAIDMMERQLGHLVRLVDDLLDLSRITHNRLELRRDRIELTPVLHQAVQAAMPLATAAGHDVRVNVPDEPMHLHGDPVRLTQVFGNLLNNSCRYTPPGGRVIVTAERQGSDAVVTIADTGTGIPRDKLESIFEMFTQVDRSLERSQGGLGIGLTLVKRLVQMHGGTVEARSEGEGRGSEFIVRLPLATGPEQSPIAQPAVGLDETQQRYRILVVDDSRDAAASLALLLQITGHETFTEHDGNAALEAAERHRPDVVLLDIGLPGLTGYEVCKRIREQAWGADILLIALTGWGQDTDRQRTREAGFDGHLVKPVEHGALLSLLNELAVARKGA